MINVRRSLKSLNDAILKAHWNFHNYFSCVGVPRQYNTLWIFSQQVKKFRLCFQSWWYMPENAFNLYITRELPLKNLFKNLHFWLSAGTPYTWARTKIFWIWFICTLEGYVVICTYRIFKKSANLKHCSYTHPQYALIKNWVFPLKSVFCVSFSLSPS